MFVCSVVCAVNLRDWVVIRVVGLGAHLVVVFGCVWLCRCVFVIWLSVRSVCVIVW